MNPASRAVCVPLLVLLVLGGLAVVSARAGDATSDDSSAPAQPDAAQAEATDTQAEESPEDEKATAVEPDAEAEEQAQEAAATDEGAAEDSDASEAPEVEQPADEGDEGSGDPEMDRLHAADEEMEKTASDLVEKHKSASMPDDREAARSELLEAVNRHFDVRQEIRTRELAELEKQIAELRQSLERRTALRDKIVQRRMTELLGDETEDLDF